MLIRDIKRKGKKKFYYNKVLNKIVFLFSIG